MDASMLHIHQMKADERNDFNLHHFRLKFSFPKEKFTDFYQHRKIAHWTNATDMKEEIKALIDEEESCNWI